MQVEEKWVRSIYFLTTHIHFFLSLTPRDVLYRFTFQLRTPFLMQRATTQKKIVRINTISHSFNSLLYITRRTWWNKLHLTVDSPAIGNYYYYYTAESQHFLHNWMSFLWELSLFLSYLFNSIISCTLKSKRLAENLFFFLRGYEHPVEIYHHYKFIYKECPHPLTKA